MLQLHNVSKNGGAKQTKLNCRQNNIPDLAMTHLEMRQQFIQDVWMDILKHQKHDENCCAIPCAHGQKTFHKSRNSFGSHLLLPNTKKKYII